MFELKVRALSKEQEALQGVRRKFAQGLEDCGRVVLPAAQALALPHIRTGRYYRSLGYSVNEPTLEASLKAGGKGARHAHLVEYGTVNMPPQAIQRKAMEASREKMGQVIAKRMQEPVL